MSNLTTLDEKYPVERSRLLDVFNFSQYTPDEMLLLDVYLSKINPADPTTKKVQFRKREYETFLQKQEQQYKTFKKAAIGLFSKFIDPDHLPDEIEFDPKHVWKELSFKKDGGEWVFTMECDEQAEPFFFNTQKYGFIRYLVGYTKNFSSKYSFILYYFLKRKRQEEVRFGNPINPTIEELKRITGTGRMKLYKEFKYFKRNIIDKAVTEICAFTDIAVRYETVKTGRTVERIHFLVEEKPAPPLLSHAATEPSKELKEMFAEELRTPEEVLSAAEPEKVKVLVGDQEVWLDRAALMAALNANGGATSGPYAATSTAFEEPLTDLERHLFGAIPPDVHQGENVRIRGIYNLVCRYFTTDITSFLEEGASYEEALAASNEAYGDQILDAINTFTIQEYNIRKKDIKSSDHYGYYKAAFEKWLKAHYLAP